MSRNAAVPQNFCLFILFALSTRLGYIQFVTQLPHYLKNQIKNYKPTILPHITTRCPLMLWLGALCREHSIPKSIKTKVWWLKLAVYFFLLTDAMEQPGWNILDRMTKFSRQLDLFSSSPSQVYCRERETVKNWIGNKSERVSERRPRSPISGMKPKL